MFTNSNGKLGKTEIGSPYAEKILIFKEGQRLPIHYHVEKTEDIINRGGGSMEVRFYNSNKDGSVDYVNDVVYYSDIVMVFAVLQKRENRLLLQQETVSVWFPM